MPIAKPAQIFGGGTVNVTHKARESLNIPRQPVNGQDFSQIFQANSQGLYQAAGSQRSDGGLLSSLPQIGPGNKAFYVGGSNQPDQPGQMFQAAQPPVRQGIAPQPPAGQGYAGVRQRAIQESVNPLQLVNSLNSLDSARLQGDAATRLALWSAGHKVKETAAKSAEAAADAAESVVGAVSALFESGNDGVAAIGYDRSGGTSYGKYQIASRTGTMDSFISYLRKEAPDLAARLKDAGVADTGGRDGKMPRVWREIARQEPERFEKLQQGFIKASHYQPALERLREKSGLGEGDLSQPVREMLFSTAVQHGAGGAERLLARALDKLGLNKESLAALKQRGQGLAEEAEKNLIREVYASRADQFGSSTDRVRNAVKNRLQNEMGAVLGMYEKV